MKKLFALLLAMMMIFSLAACGDNNTTDPDKDNPGVSQSGENNDGGEENNGGTTYDWPSDISSIKWTGSGNVVGITEVAGSEHGEVCIYIDVATLDEVGAYISSVDGDTPTLEFEYGEFYWQNYNGSLKVSLLEEPDTRAGVEGTYQLEITVFSDQF